MMENETPEFDSEKPRYLLPEGCGDLLDWIQRQEQAALGQDKASGTAPLPLFTFQDIELPKLGAPKRITKKSVTIALPAKVCLPEPVQVKVLGTQLGLTFWNLIEKLIARKIFVGPEGWINFTTAAAICAELGVVAEKEDAGELPV